jgi:hypothetical protein
MRRLPGRLSGAPRAARDNSSLNFQARQQCQRPKLSPATHVRGAFPLPAAHSTATSSASPRTHDCGSDVIFRRRAGVAQRAALAIQFVKNVIAICADPIAVEASNRQRSSIHKGDSLCRIINYNAYVIFAPGRRVSGRRTNDDDLRR